MLNLVRDFCYAGTDRDSRRVSDENKFPSALYDHSKTKLVASYITPFSAPKKTLQKYIMSFNEAPRGGRTRNLEIPFKSLTLYRLS
jgi:hypothetical protein